MKRKESMNWSQARAATDDGETHDKVKNADLAAAPLGTDEEAGGAATPERDIARSMNAASRRPDRRHE